MVFLINAAGTRINDDQAKLLAIKFSTNVSACREAALLKICEGPHITELLDSFTSASLTCLVMPHYDTTLGHMLLDSPCSFLKIGDSVMSSVIEICYTRACRKYHCFTFFLLIDTLTPLTSPPPTLKHADEIRFPLLQKTN